MEKRPASARADEATGGSGKWRRAYKAVMDSGGSWSRLCRHRYWPDSDAHVIRLWTHKVGSAERRRGVGVERGMRTEPPRSGTDGCLLVEQRGMR